MGVTPCSLQVVRVSAIEGKKVLLYLPGDFVERVASLAPDQGKKPFWVTHDGWLCLLLEGKLVGLPVEHKVGFPYSWREAWDDLRIHIEMRTNTGWQEVEDDIDWNIMKTLLTCGCG